MIRVTSEKIALFAQSLHDNNPRYFANGPREPATAPPLFGIVPTMHSLLSLFADKDVNVDFPNLLLVGQEADFFRLARAGERIYSVSTVKDILDHSGGQSLIVQSDGFTEKGETIFKDYSTFYIRDRKKYFSGLKDLRQDQHLWRLPDPSQLLNLADCPIARGQIAAYSKISGDYDPFHYFGFIARRFGYSAKFLQGTCLTALVSKLLIDGPLGGDPHRLKRISLYFWDKVSEGDTLKTQSWPLHEKADIESGHWQDKNCHGDARSTLIAFQLRNQDGTLIVPKGLGMFTKPDTPSDGRKPRQSGVGTWP